MFSEGDLSPDMGPHGGEATPDELGDFRGKRSSVAITAKSPDDLFQRLQRARSGLAFLYAERRRSSQSQFEEPSQTLFSCVVDRFQIRKRRTLPDSQQK